MNICKYCLLCCISALYLLPAALLSLLNKAKHAPIFFVGSAGICKKLDWQISMFKDDNVKPIFRNYFLKPLLSVDRYMLNVLRHVKYRWKYIKLNPPWRYRCRSWQRSWRWWERARGKSRTPPKLATEPPPEQKKFKIKKSSYFSSSHCWPDYHILISTYSISCDHIIT